MDHTEADVQRRVAPPKPCTRVLNFRTLRHSGVLSRSLSVRWWRSYREHDRSVNSPDFWPTFRTPQQPAVTGPSSAAHPRSFPQIPG